MQSEAAKRILGLDLGVGSLGWAILELEDRDSPTIIDAGVRVFEAGVDGSEDAIATGKDTSVATTKSASSSLISISSRGATAGPLLDRAEPAFVSMPKAPEWLRASA